MINADALDSETFEQRVKLVRSLKRARDYCIFVSFSHATNQALDEVIRAGAADYVILPDRRLELIRVELISRLRHMCSTRATSATRAPASDPARPSRAANLPRVRLPELHNPDSGRLDASRIADFLGVPLRRLALVVGVSYQAVHKTPDSEAVQAALRPIKGVLELLADALNDPKVIRAWLATPRSELEDASPLEVILAGEGDAVLTLLQNAFAGVPN
jgi:hypothetical protein